MSYIKTHTILEELDDIIFKLKMRIMFYQSENKKLRQTIEELKKFVKEK